MRELGLASVSPTSPSAPENWPRCPPPRGAVSTSRSEAGERACPAHSLHPGEVGGGRHGTLSAGFVGPGNEALTGTCGLERALRGIVGKLGGTTWKPRPFENFEKNSNDSAAGGAVQGGCGFGVSQPESARSPRPTVVGGPGIGGRSWFPACAGRPATSLVPVTTRPSRQDFLSDGSTAVIITLGPSPFLTEVSVKRCGPSVRDAHSSREPGYQLAPLRG